MEFTGNKSIITPESVFIIGTYDENGVPNAMNAAWGMQSDMGEITLMLSKHKTTENFEKTGAFTVAFGVSYFDFCIMWNFAFDFYEISICAACVFVVFRIVVPHFKNILIDRLNVPLGRLAANINAEISFYSFYCACVICSDNKAVFIRRESTCIPVVGTVAVLDIATPEIDDFNRLCLSGKACLSGNHSSIGSFKSWFDFDCILNSRVGRNI